MTGALMPEYWAEAELSPARPKLSLLQWMLQPRAVRQRAYAAGPDRDPEPTPGVDNAKRDYLADIW